MRESAIVRALAELDRWTRKRAELLAHGAGADRGELEKVDRQITYYRALTEDMKREVRPARTSDLFALFR